MSEFNYTKGDFFYPGNLVTDAATTVLQLKSAQELDAVDIDAGRVDSQLTDYIAAKEAEVVRQQQLLGMEGTPYRVYANALLFSRDGNFQFGEDAKQLRNELTTEEADVIWPLLEGVMYSDKQVAELFPGDFGFKPEQAFGEAVTKLLPALVALKRGDALPTVLPMRGDGDGKIKIDTYTLDDAIRLLERFNVAVGRMAWLKSSVGYSFLRVTTNRVFSADNFAMYRVLSDRDPSEQMLTSIRMKAGLAYNPAIEYGSSKGTQQSIGHTVDMGSNYVSPYKKEQVDPFCIRIDNEGDHVAMDIGSIFGKKGTLGKGIADLLALGDYLQAERMGTQFKFNHADEAFLRTDFHDVAVFGRTIAATLLMYEARATTDLPKVLARAGKAAASLRQPAGSR